MSYFIVRIIVYFSCFALSFYALSCLNMEKLILKNQTVKAQLLLVLMALALGYLTAQFLFGISYSYY